MKTLICTSPGNLDYGIAADPVLRKGEALLKIRRIGICGTDLHAYEGTQPFFNYPRILGHEIGAELIEADGMGDFEPGEQVTIIPYFSCGTCVACRMGKPNCCVSIRVSGVHIDGGMAEYLSVPVSAVVHGEGLSLEALALIEPLAIGAHAVRRAAITPGEFVLVVGAGPIGLGIMEFARIAGAHVIAMDVNEKRLAFCRQKLKIENTVLASSSAAQQALMPLTHGDMPAVIFDATGNKNAIEHSFNLMAHGGRYILVGLQKELVSFSHPEFHKREATLMSSRNATRLDFEQVIFEMKKGSVDPVNYITHRVKFGQVKREFAGWLDPVNGVIKAMVEL